MTYHNRHWLTTSVAESLVASERVRQPFGVHSNELVNDEYCYDWSVAWWICRKTGRPVSEATMLEIE
jgi:hypothetical protein